MTLGSSDQAQFVTSSAASSHVPYRSLKAGCRLAAREQEQKPQQLALDEGRDQAAVLPALLWPSFDFFSARKGQA